MRVIAFLVVLATAIPAGAQDAAPSFHTGDPVDVLYNTTWYPATVLSVPWRGQWEISYDGYGENWNQTVGSDHIRARTPTPPAPPPPPPPGRAIPHLMRLTTGVHVLVEWHGTWYPARVMRVLDDTLVRIQYVGYAHSSDEDIGADRVRMPDKR